MGRAKFQIGSAVKCSNFGNFLENGRFCVSEILRILGIFSVEDFPVKCYAGEDAPCKWPFLRQVVADFHLDTLVKRPNMLLSIFDNTFDRAIIPLGAVFLHRAA